MVQLEALEPQALKVLRDRLVSPVPQAHRVLKVIRDHPESRARRGPRVRSVRQEPQARKVLKDLLELLAQPAQLGPKDNRVVPV